MASYPKIDVHHHIIPPEFIGNMGGLPGMKKLDWSLEIDKSFNQSVGVKTSILSFTSPGVTLITDPEESAKTARAVNELCAKIRDNEPDAYGFFATLPSLEYTELALQELRYAFDTLHADGVILFTRYGPDDGYLGNEAYVPIWQELNLRKAVVFVHPTNNKNDKLFNDKLPFPAFDWPHETGRTAMDLILHRRMYQFSDVKIILSHAGGTLPLLTRRSNLISQPQLGGAMSAEDINEQAKRFYFDLALSGSDEVLPLILKFARPGHLLFGSDFPHATTTLATEHTRFIDEFDMSDDKRKEVYYEAAVKLFPRFKKVYN